MAAPTRETRFPNSSPHLELAVYGRLQTPKIPTGIVTLSERVHEQSSAFFHEFSSKMNGTVREVVRTTLAGG